MRKVNTQYKILNNKYSMLNVEVENRAKGKKYSCKLQATRQIQNAVYLHSFGLWAFDCIA
jgi:hypothetical protein